MPTFFGTKIADDTFLVNTGGDVAFLNGALKHIIERDLLDHAFLEQHTTGFAEAAATGDRAQIQGEVGDLLFAVVNLARQLGVDAALDRRSEAVEAHREVVEALRMRDVSAAGKAANHILDLAARDLVSAKKSKKD